MLAESCHTLGTPHTSSRREPGLHWYSFPSTATKYLDLPRVSWPYTQLQIVSRQLTSPHCFSSSDSWPLEQPRARQAANVRVHPQSRNASSCAMVQSGARPSALVSWSVESHVADSVASLAYTYSTSLRRHAVIVVSIEELTSRGLQYP